MWQCFKYAKTLAGEISLAAALASRLAAKAAKAGGIAKYVKMVGQ